MTSSWRILAVAAAFAGTLSATPLALAMGGGDPAPAAQAEDADYAAGWAAVKSQSWDLAITHLTKAVANNSSNADAHNYLAYALRHKGDFKAAVEHYGHALKLDPKHKGAHEYLGEAYLGLGDLAKAEAELKTLDGLCTFGCEEFTQLKNAIAAYKAKKGG